MPLLVTGPRQGVRVWLLFILLPVMALILLTSSVLLLQKTFFPPTLTEYERLLPDGSILKIEALTIANLFREQTAEYRPARAPWDVFSPFRVWELKHMTSPSHVVVWMSRRSASSGQPLDFDWWQENVVVDAFGDEVSDAAKEDLAESHGEAQQLVLHEIVDDVHHARVVTERPPLANREQFKAWVLSSPLPLFRPQGNRMRLKVKNTNGQTVAEFDLPHPDPKCIPDWKAPEFPIRLVKDDVEVVVKRVDLKVESRPSRGLWELSPTERPFFRPEVAVDLRWKGMPTTGNVLASFTSPYGRPLRECLAKQLPKEKVWHMSLKCWKDKSSHFPDDERGEIPNLPLPTQETATTSTASAAIGETRFEVLAVGRAGESSLQITPSVFGYPDNRPEGRILGGDGKSIGPISFHFAVRSLGEKQGAVRLRSTHPWVLIRILKHPQREVLIDYSAKNEEGEAVKCELQTLPSQLPLRLLLLTNLPSDSQSVSVSITQHQPVTFETLIELP